MKKVIVEPNKPLTQDEIDFIGEKLAYDSKIRVDENVARRKLEEIDAAKQILDRKASASRAMSITVGTAFGGTSEVGMRAMDGSMLWCLLQPVEVVELIHQLAANVGCTADLKPRRDFAAWRNWRVTEEEQLRLNGWAPHVNDMAPYQQLGIRGMDHELVEKIELGEEELAIEDPRKPIPPNNSHIEKAIKDRSNNDAVATKKTVNRRSAKRAPKAT